MKYFEGSKDEGCECTGEHVLLLNNKESQMIVESLAFASKKFPRKQALKTFSKLLGDEVMCWTMRKSDFKLERK
jgi:hypothetical protein